MFTFLKYLLRNAQSDQFTGALSDERKQSEKADDIHFNDIVATANVVSWSEKYPNVRTFPEYDQKNSYTCGANSLAKVMGIMFSNTFGTYLPFSRAHIYQRRIGKDNHAQGMAMYDMFNIASQGVTLEQLVTKQLNNEEDYDTALIENWMQKEGETWKITGAVYIPNSIETIASTIQTTGKGIILCTWFLSGEWAKTIPYIVEPTLRWDDSKSLRHFVVAVDYTLYKGVKYLVIEDSAHFGGISRRLVSEEWVDKRVKAAGYPMNFTFRAGVSNRPTYDMITVISAQVCLRYEGLFPINVSYSENVGPITRRALSDFQMKYKLPVTQALDTQTINQLHFLYP